MTEPIQDTPKPRDPRALNAYRHGLTGQVVVVEPHDQAAYQDHCQGILASLSPQGALETSLAQAVADDRWRLQRAAAIEENIFARGLAQPDDITAHHDQVDTALAVSRVWLEQSQQLARLALYESRIQRKMERNLALLQKLQQDRRQALREAAEEARLLAQLAESNGQAYDIARDFPAASLPGQFVFSAPQIARAAAHYTSLAQAANLFRAPRKPVPVQAAC